MIRIGLLLAILSLAAAAPAQEHYAPGQQALTEMLSGNSMEGIWDGRPYLQYIGPNGRTRYREQGGEESEGRWRATRKANIARCGRRPSAGPATRCW